MSCWAGSIFFQVLHFVQHDSYKGAIGRALIEPYFISVKIKKNARYLNRGMDTGHCEEPFSGQ